jgi:hypothetical protein
MRSIEKSNRSACLVYYSDMTRVHRHLAPPDEELRPTYSPPGRDYELQVAAMKELRELSAQIGNSYRARDERLYALANSGSLSRQDMATSIGLNKSRVDQIIKEMAEEDRRSNSAAAAERVRRHLPS